MGRHHDVLIAVIGVGPAKHRAHVAARHIHRRGRRHGLDVLALEQRFELESAELLDERAAVFRPPSPRRPSNSGDASVLTHFSSRARSGRDGSSAPTAVSTQRIAATTLETLGVATVTT